MHSGRNVKILTWLQLCTVVAVILAARFYIKPQPSVSAALTPGMVNGILYSPDSPSALIDNQVMRVGDTIYGVKVVRIDKGMVAFEKNGKRWEQRVHQSPDPAWDEADPHEDETETTCGSIPADTPQVNMTVAPSP